SPAFDARVFGQQQVVASQEDVAIAGSAYVTGAGPTDARSYVAGPSREADIARAARGEDGAPELQDLAASVYDEVAVFDDDLGGVELHASIRAACIDVDRSGSARDQIDLLEQQRASNRDIHVAARTAAGRERYIANVRRDGLTRQAQIAAPGRERLLDRQIAVAVAVGVGVERH